MVRTNQATVTDNSMMEAFQQGVEEGHEAFNMAWVYVVELFFEGTKLRATEYSDLASALDEIRTHLENGPGTSATIEVRGDKVEGKAVAAGEQGVTGGEHDDEVVDAEVVS